MAERPLVSVLFITFDRAQTLVPTYRAFVDRVAYPRDRLELILCDDASSPAHREVMDRLAFDRIVRAERNQGLGANHNRGLAAATGAYILSLQDDCLLVGDPHFLDRAIAVLEANSDIAMLNYGERADLPVRARRDTPSGPILFYGMAGDAGPYSDQPHIKRASFHRVAGPYLEGKPMWVTEREFVARTGDRADAVIATVAGPSPFEHIGAAHSHNLSTVRAARRERLFALPLIGPTYRRLRQVAKRILRR